MKTSRVYRLIRTAQALTWSLFEMTNIFASGKHDREIIKKKPCIPLYIDKLGYAGLYLSFLIFAPKHA